MTVTPPDHSDLHPPFMQDHEVETLCALLRRYDHPITALEWGSGYSTAYFCSRLPFGSTWLAVEHNPAWAAEVTQLCASRAGSCTVAAVPPNGYWDDASLDDGDFRTFRNYVVYPSRSGTRYDFILVDGRARVECMAVGWDLLACGGIMALHDAERPEYVPGIPKECYYIRVSGQESSSSQLLLMSREPARLCSLLSRLVALPARVTVTHNLPVAAPPAGRILFLNTHYTGFLRDHYRSHEGLEQKPYYVQKRLLAESCFGDSDFYSAGLALQEWEAEDVAVNCQPMQKAWAREHGLEGSDDARIILEQVRTFQPDVIYLQDLGLASEEFLTMLRPHARLIAGQIASPLPPHAFLPGLDIIFSSFPHFVADFRSRGKTSYYQPLAFEPRVLQRLPALERTVPLSFVGGISPHHGKGLEILQKVSSLVPLDVWGYGAESLPADSPLRQRHHGETWGLDMFSVLRSSAMTLNRHIDVARHNANNMRLFEATGCGALLITDYKENLQELFEPGSEVVAYRSPEEAAALIRYYRRYPEEAAAIARAGQERALRDHTYAKRMEQTAEILERHLRYGSQRGTYPLPDSVSGGYRLIKTGEIADRMTEAWKDETIPAKQRGLVQLELEQMYAGDVRQQFSALADLLRPIVRAGMTILELGCSSGYYYEILEYLLGCRIDYTGVDYSDAMISMARDFYPRPQFFAADGRSLFFADRSFDVVISSCILLHVPNYRVHIEETARVARDWVVAARTPICRRTPTVSMSKRAYGVETVEFRFNEQEFLEHFSIQGFDRVAERVLHTGEENDDFCISYLFKRRAVPA